MKTTTRDDVDTSLTTASHPTSAHRRPLASSALKIFSALSGVTSLGIILQGLWAGIFLSSDNRPEKWVEVHDAGAKVTLVLSVLTAIWALWKLRDAKALWIGAVVLALAVAAVGHLGSMITEGGQDNLTAVHVPLAMVILALSVWLPMHARGLRKG